MKASQPYKYITAVKNGKHYVVFDFKDRESKRKRKWVSTELPEKCTKKALYAVLSDPNISKQPLGEFFSDWIAYIKPNVARTTHLCYRRTADRYLEYINKNYPDLTLGEIHHYYVQNFLNYKFDKGLNGS